MMRVLHVVPSYLPAVRYGGPVVAVHGLCRALVGEGHRVDVFTTCVDGADDLDVPRGTRIERDGVGVHYFPVVHPRRWYRSPALATALRDRVRDYDLVHVHALFLHPVSAAAGAAWRAGVPYVVSPRGMLVRDLFARRSRFLKHGWLALTGRRVLQRADALHLTSEQERRDVGAFGLTLRESFVLPNGLDAIPAPGGSRVPCSLLFLGRISWKKGIDRLIEALPLLPDCELVVAGNDDEKLTPTLRALAQRLGVARRLRFEGAVDTARKAELLARASVFVLASHSENFANSVLEAMASACPVVITSRVGLASTVREHGCGVVCGASAGELAAGVRRVLDDSRGAAAMGAAGRALVEQRFLWPHVAREMAEAYTRVIRGGARTP